MTTSNSSKTNIEIARATLPEESRKAIDAVDWKTVVFGMKDSRKLSFNQIEVLGNQTELLLCGLLDSAKYPKVLENGLGISSEQTNELVNEMNEKVFKKIREELIKNISNKKESATTSSVDQVDKIENREELLEKIENPVPVPPTIPSTPSILNQKLSGSFHIPAVKTEHTITNMSKGSGEEKTKLPKVDPYRMPIE